MLINNTEKTVVAGAGLVGSLLSLILARKGFEVELIERRADPRSFSVGSGRSINLAISTRGINALQSIGIADEILKWAIPMRGRFIHARHGSNNFLPYGILENQCINSISRQLLNKILLDHAEATNKVQLQFEQKITGVDFKQKSFSVVNEQTGASIKKHYNVLIATDGSASAVRDSMKTLPGFACQVNKLEYGYKELIIPADKNGEFQMEKNALHIWPRQTFMLIALPNFEGSYTCTLFLPFEGEQSFAKLNTPANVLTFFEQEFPDALSMMPDLVKTFFANPTGHMDTVKCGPWNHESDTLLVGDAAHGMVPFFGQGMNCGFEDCTVLSELMDKHSTFTNSDWSSLFSRFFAQRKINTDAIADMAVENFVEMRDKVADERFKMEKAVEKILEKRFPEKYISRYVLVTFYNTPYKLAYDAGIVESEILKHLCQGLNNPEAVDISLAEALINEKLTPLLRPYQQHFEMMVSR